MKFSLFLNSRLRTNLLRNFLSSVDEMTFDKNNIEILIKYDNDDELTHAFSKENLGFLSRSQVSPPPLNSHSIELLYVIYVQTLEVHLYGNRWIKLLHISNSESSASSINFYQVTFNVEE